MVTSLRSRQRKMISSWMMSCHQTWFVVSPFCCCSLDFGKLIDCLRSDLNCLKLLLLVVFIAGFWFRYYQFHTLVLASGISHLFCGAVQKSLS